MRTARDWLPRALLWALLASCGVACSSPGAPRLADREPGYARMLGLGNEYELVDRAQLVRLNEGIGLRPHYFRSERTGTFMGYLPAGTRLRVEHVWHVPAEDPVPRFTRAIATLRVLPDHRPLEFPLVIIDPLSPWRRTATGGIEDVVVLSPEHFRRVTPEERTPEQLIVPLTRRQEWPKGWGRR